MHMLLKGVHFLFLAVAASFNVPAVDTVLDLHGDPSTAQLVIFASGNQWMVMDDLVTAFQKAHPEVKSVYFETLPPGVEAAQMDSGALQVGNLLITVKPDVVMAGHPRMQQLAHDSVAAQPIVYARSRLAILVRAGNPKHITGLADLGRPDVRIAMPDPKIEGVGRLIVSAYERTGGSALVNTIMNVKVHDRTTILTQIHHRQTPMFLLDGSVDAGPLWLTEALYQERIGSPVSTVRLPDTVNVEETYEAAAINSATHRANARAFVEFLQTPAAHQIYRSYGFSGP